MQNIFGNNLRAARKKLSLTQEEFAKPLGIKGTSISAMERGVYEPSQSVLDLIDIKHRIILSWLFSGEGEMFRKEDDTYIYKDTTDEDPEVAKLLTMTREILKSDTDYADSLAANIKSFHKSVLMERQLHNHEERLRLIEHGRTKTKEIIRKEDPPDTREELIKKRAT